MISFKKYLFAFALLPVMCGCTSNSWEPFINQEGNFKISFPGPHKFREQVKASMYGQLDVKMYYGEEGGNNPVNDAYMILFTDFNDTDMNSGMGDSVVSLFLDGAVEEGLANAKGRLLQKEDVRLGKYHGRRVKFAFGDDDHRMYMKMFLVGHREYALSVVCSKKKRRQSQDRTVPYIV